MNDYASRSEISPVDRVATRAPAIVAAVQPSSSGNPTGQGGAPAIVTPDVLPVDTLAVDADVAGAAEYAKVHARIADILADMRSASQAPSVDGAAAQIQSMMSVPIILVPLPPATREAVEHAALIAKRMADQASYAYAAQAHVKRGTVDQVLSTSN